MKRVYLVLITAMLLFVIQPDHARAQTGQLLGGNVLNGAITGGMLGAATMGLNNSGDLTPLRIGLGAGILGGAAVALYDVVTLPSGQQFFISGVFNDGSNSSIIILLDTFYGAAGGALLGTAVMLVTNKPILEGLQYGSGIGAWTGFAFGLLDSFVFAERNRDFVSSSDILNRSSLLEFSAAGLDIGMLRPELILQKNTSIDQLSVRPEPVLGVVNFSRSF
jgi:hypothetical protein